jgi:hypothetical protein
MNSAADGQADQAPDVAPGETADEVPAAPVPAVSRDAAYWAAATSHLKLGEVPPEALNLGVSGKRLTGPIQGFGKLWQKTYTVPLTGAEVGPADAVAVWKAEFATFWPAQGRFYGPLTGIAPGDGALLNLTAPGRLTMSTGIMVLYADDESFTFMTPLGHVFAGWITFAATKGADEVTTLEVQALIRASDPLYELAMPIAVHRQEDRFWAHTLRNVATRLGVEGPEVNLRAVCVDRRRQWGNAGNVRHNAGIRAALHKLATPVRALRRRPPTA